MQCIRCGREGHMEYAPDGQAYCGSCIFYGLNKPCWRCRMYLPSSELQQYNGQWTCPYCIMDMRDEERRREELGREQQRPRDEKKREDEWLDKMRQSEQCERCGRTLIQVFYFNGRKLCGSCVQDEKDKGSGVGPERPPLSPYRIKEKSGRSGELPVIVAIENRIGDLLALLGLKKKKDEKKDEKKTAKQDALDRYHGVLKDEKKTAFSSEQPIKEERLREKKRKRHKIEAMVLDREKSKNSENKS